MAPKPPRKTPIKPIRLAKTRPAAKAPRSRSPKRTAEERKARAIELCLIAIASGWTMVRFAKHSHIARGQLVRWMAEDTVQPRWIRAMQAKALMLPDEASEIVSRMVDGRKVVKRDANGEPVKDENGAFVFVIEYLDPKAGRAALSHYEFRMQREIKAGYQATMAHTVTTDTTGMTDEQLDAKFDELMQRHQMALPAPSQRAPDGENEKAGA